MTINVEKNEVSGDFTITIKGHFNFGVNVEFRRALETVSGTRGGLTIDMSMVDEIDSSALGMLLLLREQCGGANSDIKIIKARPDICEVLKMANFQSIFDMRGIE